jgi:hypothetical protein
LFGATIRLAKRNYQRTLKRAVELETMNIVTSDDLLAMSADDYQRIRISTTRAGLRKERRFVCELCGHPVYAPRDVRGRPYWAHHRSAPEGCPWWTGSTTSVDDISASQFQGAQEGALHLRLKQVIAELLVEDESTSAGSVVVDEYLLTENGRRRPDVRAIHSGVQTVFEIQLAATQMPIIVGREDFYDSEAIRLLWLTWNFEPPTAGRPLPSAVNDIYYSHAKNLFSLDQETVARSRSEDTLFVRAFWQNHAGWQNKTIRLAELEWLPSGRACAVRPEVVWSQGFRARWLSATAENGTRWLEMLPLLDELMERLALPSVSGRDLAESGACDLVNCLLSLELGSPIGSAQSNLVELLNTFFNVDRRHRYARIVMWFANAVCRSDLLAVPSVKRKIAIALNAHQDGQLSLPGRIAIALFPSLARRRRPD